MFNWCWLVRRQQWWPKRHPLLLADAQNIVIDYLHYNEYCYVLVFVLFDHNMVFGYGYCWWQNQLWRTNAPHLPAVSMATVVRRSNTDGIARCGMSRATLEATGCRHRATTHYISPQRPPGQQANKQQSTNTPKKVAVLVAMAMRQYVTAGIAQWRRSRASLEATGRCHWASIMSNNINQTWLRRFFWCFHRQNHRKRSRVDA